MTVRTLTATFLAVNLAVLLPPVTSAQPRPPRRRRNRWWPCPRISAS